MTHTIPEWARPFVAARERGATIQYKLADNDTWYDGGSNPNWFMFGNNETWYRIKPNTDPGNRTADPLIWGASIPGTEPVAVRDEYVPLTKDEAWSFWESLRPLPVHGTVAAIHRAGWEGRRTP